MKAKNKRKDRSIYKQLLKLWSNENPIKTHKLQVLLLVNAILLCTAALRGNFLEPSNRFFFTGGAILCMVWTISIGRTMFFQKIWQVKINRIAEKYPADARFHVHQYKDDIKKLPLVLRIAGGVSSTYYLLGVPIIFFLVWMGMLILSFIQYIL